MRDQQTSATWRNRFESGGVTVNLVTQNVIQSVAEHATHLREAGLIVIDLAGDPAPTASLRELREFTAPNVPVLVLGELNDLAYARQLRQLGASEYFAHPIEPNELILTARRLLQLDSANTTRNGRLIAVHGLRGGVGASLITAGLVTVISQQHGRNCAAVDLNFSSPAVGSWLGCDQPGRLNALLQDVQRLDQALLDQIVQSPFPQLNVYDGNLDHEDDGEGNTVPNSTALRGLSQLLAERHSCQVWRTPPGPAARTVLLDADLCVLVADGSFPSLRAALALLPWIRQCRPLLNTTLVFNQTRPHMPLSADQFAHSIGQSIPHRFAYQRRLGEQAIDNLPFNRPSHVLHRALAQLAVDLLKLPPVSTRRWWQGGME
ncbi:MinD/ParA family protein [Herbaspirillum sp. RV1423]|uniref:AAA family ATPase n=1 Tax=Herbaspirillum sp. RV1423 TaxID=1443993 RepID=UPI0004BB315B|nr:MinD/ParA family protein [Herbaspirillum sp. RV1423]